MTAKFNFHVETPDLGSTSASMRKQAKVIANVTESGELAGSIDYGLGPGGNVISLTRMEVRSDCRGKGCGRGMIKALRAHYPGRIILDGGNTNSADGDGFLTVMRREGLVEADPDGRMLESWLDSLPESERFLAGECAEWDGFEWHDGRPKAGSDAMLFSAFTPSADSELSNAIRLLSAEAQALGNLIGTSAEERLASYQAWASQASAMLRSAFDLDNVQALINTQRHDFLLSKAWVDTPLVINNAISAEQADRAKVFMSILDGLRTVEARRLGFPQFLVVPDTNIFLHQERYFDDIDWYELVTVSAEFRVMIPMAIVRELDKAKRAQPGKKVSDTNNEAVRTRARGTSRRLRELFADPHQVQPLGKLGTIELLLDPVGHRPLDDPDSEIIDRALSLKILSGKQVHVLTGDGNMQFMADVAGLKVVALAD